jgi:chitosanase
MPVPAEGEPTMGPRRLIVALVVPALFACGPEHREAPWPTGGGSSTVTLTTDQRRIADQLVNVFEYGDTRARYDAVDDLRDWRGYTCGRAGFTTSSGEVRDLVAAYLDEVPDSPVGRHLPRLRELAADGSGEVTGLDGFRDDWARAAADPRFRALQDAAVDRVTFQPALASARRIGIRTALGVAVLFDTAVQHGTGDDPDGLPALLSRASAAAKGEPAGGVPEKAWLLAFLSVRAADLRDPHDADTRAVWAESVDRVDALRRLVDADQHRLDPPLTVSVFGDRYELR